MKKLEKKCDRELTPGTKVVSHCFTFPNKEPKSIKIIPVGRRTKKLLVYEW
jgi:hypothetical protein